VAAPQQGNGDILVRKYTSSGDILWTRQFGGPLPESARFVTTDAAGNVFLAGTTWSQLDPDFEHVGDLSDCWVAMLNPQGFLQWIHQFGTSDQDTINQIALGPGGKLYIAGSSYGNMFGTAPSGGAFLMALDLPEPVACALFIPLLALLGRRNERLGRCIRDR
jgi:hypothetical protein